MITRTNGLVERDKLLHFLVGLVLSLGYLIAPLGFMVLTIICIAVAKEIWDAQGHGTPEVMDAIVTIFGGGLGLAAIELLKELA